MSEENSVTIGGLKIWLKVFTAGMIVCMAIIGWFLQDKFGSIRGDSMRIEKTISRNHLEIRTDLKHLTDSVGGLGTRMVIVESKLAIERLTNNKSPDGP
jgi:hypothetical protein